MRDPETPGKIVVLNGVPRSGKSSIVAAIQRTFDGPWLNLGVDVFKEHVIPEHLGPGIGLRPGANRPDLEVHVDSLFAGLYGSVAALGAQGLNVVVDVGHHEDYSRPLHVLRDCARRLEGLPALLVGVRCPIEVIMERRNAGQPGREGVYATGSPDDPIPASVRVWQREVHRPGVYDLEVDTSRLSPSECAEAIRACLDDPPGPSAFERLRARDGEPG